MRLFWTECLAIGVACLGASAARAEVPAAACEAVRTACTSAGYRPGGFTSGKGVKYDCLEHLLKGTPVAGVKVSADAMAEVKAAADLARRGGPDAENAFENACIYTPEELQTMTGGSSEPGSNGAVGPSVVPDAKACQSIRTACAAGGYVPGGFTRGKGIKTNCLEPLLHDQSVAGVRVEPEAIEVVKKGRALAEHSGRAAANAFENACIYAEPTNDR